MSLTVISGGSTGAERGALQAAIDLGLAIGGWRCAGDDTPPIFAESMRTTSSADRGMARRLCVQDSDGVLAVSTQVAQLGGVIAFVDRQAEAQGKAFMSVTLGNGSDAWRAQILYWMKDQGIHRLYVTGPAEDDEPGITVAARAFLKWLLEGLALDELGKFIDIVRVLEGSEDSDQPVTPPAAVARGSMIRPADLEPEQWPAETRQQSYSNYLAPVAVADQAAEWVAMLEHVPRPLDRLNVDRLTKSFYKLPGNGAGGSLHIVLDDSNWEREHVEFCRGYAQQNGDVAGERFAELLLTLTDEQLHDWLGPGYCGRCCADLGDQHAGQRFATPGGLCPVCGSEPADPGPSDCRGEPLDVTIGLPGDDLGTPVDLKPGEFLITREQHRQLMVDIVTGKKQIEHEILEATCTDPDAFTRAMDHEVAAANETADRRERCLDAAGLTDFPPKPEGDPPA